MTAVILAELLILALSWAVFAALLLARFNSKDPTQRQLLGMAVVGLAEAGSLFALGMGWPVPPWVFAVGFGAADLLAVRWLWLLAKARNWRRRDVD